MKLLIVAPLLMLCMQSFAEDKKNDDKTQAEGPKASFSRQPPLPKTVGPQPALAPKAAPKAASKSDQPQAKTDDKAKSPIQDAKPTLVTKPVMKAAPSAPKLSPAITSKATSTPKTTIPAKATPAISKTPPAVIKPVTILQKPVIRPTPPPAVIRPPLQVNTFAEHNAQIYRTQFHQQLVQRQVRYQAPTFFAPLRAQYHPWHALGFYAFGWEVRPVVEFYSYFSNPCVSWFYNDYDAEFYRPFYGQYAERYPDLGNGYRQQGIFLPTEEFIRVNVLISEMPVEYQVHYRRGMSALGDRLSESVRGLGRHEVVVNHYQMLRENRAVLIEGFVDSAQTQMPFRALIDLRNHEMSQLFFVNGWVGERIPSPYETRDLYELNDQVVEFGGTLESPPSY